MIWPEASQVFQPVIQSALNVALVLVGGYILFLFVLLLVAMRRAGSLRAQRAAAASIRPKLQASLVEFLAGGTDESLFRSHIRTHSADIAEVILLFQMTVGGSARERVCDLALKLGLVHRWYEECGARDLVRRRTAFASMAFACVYEPCRRVGGDLLIRAVNDGDQEVRLSACRGLALAGDAEHVQDLFALAIQSDLLTRVVLTEHLRLHALALSAGPVQEALSSSDPSRVRAALEILVAWERAIPLGGLCDLLEHRDREIRLLALRLAAFVAVDSDSRLAVLRTLRDADAGARSLAIVAVGRQKITEAVPALELCLESARLEEARLAASALAAMPPQGWRLLEEQTGSSNPSTKLAAEEALARARKDS
jgi:HEAT repeat protein